MLSTLYKKLHALVFPGFPAGRLGVALLLLRLMVGAGMVAHGYFKIIDIGAFADRHDLPLFLGAAAAISEFVGGMFILLGALTPFWGLMIAITMTEAVRTHITRGDPFYQPGGPGYELALFYLTAIVVILILGPGRFSVDSLLFKK